MAQYIEFIGVSGIGKSTTYQFLRKHRQEAANWITYHDLLRKTGKERIGSVEFFLRALFKPDTLPRKTIDWDMLDGFTKAYPELIERFWRSFPKNKRIRGKDLRFQVVQYILGILEKMQTIEDEDSNKLCLVDEGLIHNLNYFTDAASEAENLKQIREILGMISLPSAVVYFDGNVETVVERTLGRGSLKPRDKALNLPELREERIQCFKEKQMFIDAIAEKVIPTLVLSSGESVNEKSQKINDFIRNLNKTREVQKVLSPKAINV